MNKQVTELLGNFMSMKSAVSRHQQLSFKNACEIGIFNEGKI